MSYDLGVFGINNLKSDIPKLYSDACEGKIRNICSSKEVVAFIADVQQMYPDLNCVNESNIDTCPWSCGFDISDRHWIGSMSFSFVDEMLPRLIALAEKHRVHLYDPQEEQNLT